MVRMCLLGLIYKQDDTKLTCFLRNSKINTVFVGVILLHNYQETVQTLQHSSRYHSTLCLSHSFIVVVPRRRLSVRALQQEAPGPQWQQPPWSREHTRECNRIWLSLSRPRSKLERLCADFNGDPNKSRWNQRASHHEVAIQLGEIDVWVSNVW